MNWLRWCCRWHAQTALSEASPQYARVNASIAVRACCRRLRNRSADIPRASADSGPETSRISPSTYARRCGRSRHWSMPSVQPIFTFLDEKGTLGVGWPIRREALDQVVGEPLKVQVHVLDRTLLYIKNEVDGDAEDPRLEFAAEIELRQSGDHSHQDFLRGIFRVFAIPQHA